MTLLQKNSASLIFGLPQKANTSILHTSGYNGIVKGKFDWMDGIFAGTPTKTGNIFVGVPANIPNFEMI